MYRYTFDFIPDHTNIRSYITLRIRLTRKRWEKHITSLNGERYHKKGKNILCRPIGWVGWERSPCRDWYIPNNREEITLMSVERSRFFRAKVHLRWQKWLPAKMYGLKLCPGHFFMAVAKGTLRKGKAIAGGERAKWIGFMAYCLVCHLQGSISLDCMLGDGCENTK